MNEKMDNTFNKYSSEDIENLNKMIVELRKEYGEDVKLKTSSEHIIYTKKDGSRVMMTK